MAREQLPERRLSKPRLLAFSALTAAVLLLAVNTAVERLEQLGVVATLRPGDFVQHVDDEIFVETESGHWVKSPYALKTMVRGGFSDDPAPDRRIFLVGGSFAMGGPFADPSTGDEREGTPSSWLRAFLRASNPGLRVEVVNAGAMGQDSHRVRRVSELLFDHHPSALVVASCNNEAWMPEGEVREALRSLGGYRLLDRLLRPEPAARPRLHTPTDNEDALRAQFEANLRDIARMGRERGVPVYLSTVPVNLRYSGLEREAAWQGADLENADCLQRGISLAEQLLDEEAAQVLGTCAGAPESELWLALLDLRMAGSTPRRSHLVDELGECVTAGLERFYGGAYEAAISQLSTCDNVHEALRWVGLSQLALGNVRGATAALEESVNLFPRNRCRPEFNEVVRSIASEGEGVYLVDLDRAVRVVADQGLPGADLFVDVCHMNQRGYGIVAEAMWHALKDSGLLGETNSVPELEQTAAALGIQLR
jgi:lysophospholipase L1-like esterase